MKHQAESRAGREPKKNLGAPTTKAAACSIHARQKNNDGKKY